MNGAVIGHGSIVAGGAFAKEASVFPPAPIIAGMPAKVIKPRDCARDNRVNAWQYWRNAQAYWVANHRAWEGAEYERWVVEIRAQIDREADREVPIG